MASLQGGTLWRGKLDLTLCVGFFFPLIFGEKRKMTLDGPRVQLAPHRNFFFSFMREKKVGVGFLLSNYFWLHLTDCFEQGKFFFLCLEFDSLLSSKNANFLDESLVHFWTRKKKRPPFFFFAPCKKKKSDLIFFSFLMGKEGGGGRGRLPACCWARFPFFLCFSFTYLVDPASSHMLVSKIKPCMSKYKQLYTVKLRKAH